MLTSNASSRQASFPSFTARPNFLHPGFSYDISIPRGLYCFHVEYQFDYASHTIWPIWAFPPLIPVLITALMLISYSYSSTFQAGVVLSCAHPENSMYMVEQRWKERMRQEWGRPKHSPFEWNVIKISVFQSHNACQSCIWFCGGPSKAGDSSRNKSFCSIWLAQNGVKGTISLQLQSSGMKSPSILGRHAMWTAVIQCPTWKQSGRKQSGLNPKLDF